MKQNIGVVLVATVVVLVVLSLSMFVVDQRQNAIVFRFGEIVSIKKAPGLFFKLPLIDNVRFFDVRVLTIESSEPERFLTSEKKNVLVDLFVKWRIAEVDCCRPSMTDCAPNSAIARSTMWYRASATGSWS